MLHSVVYLIDAKPSLVEVLTHSDPDLLECLKGPSAWLAKESATSMDDLPAERLTKFKILYSLWLLHSFKHLSAYITTGSGISLEIIDQYWDIRRIEVDGELADLRRSADKFDFTVVVPTGDPTVDEWLLKMRRTGNTA